MIKRDLLNGLNIRQGQLPGRPGYGTTVWDFLFEPQLETVQNAIQQEVRRVVAQDPRIVVNSIQSFPQGNGILLEIELEVVPSTDAERLAIFFDLEQQVGTYV